MFRQINLPNATDDDPFKDLYASEALNDARDRNTVVMPASQPSALTVPAAHTPSVEAWWQNPATWLKILTPLVVVVWCFYLGLYFHSPTSVPDTLVPPGMRQEAQVPQKKVTTPSTRPTQQQAPAAQTTQTPVDSSGVKETATHRAESSGSPSALPSPIASPKTSASPLPEETPKTSPSPQQSTPTDESTAAPSEAPATPSSEPSPEPSTDGGEEQATSDDPAAAPPE